MPHPRTHLDTRNHTDARLCGYDGPVCPREDGEGLIVTEVDGMVVLNGSDGEIRLHPGEVAALAPIFAGIVRFAPRASVGRAAA